jgi:hypothetical protein
MTPTHPSQVSVRRYLPQILGFELRRKLENKLALLLFAVLLMSLDADLTFCVERSSPKMQCRTSANNLRSVHVKSGGLP